MSQTMSNPNDWSHFYNHHHQQQQHNFSSSTAAAASTLLSSSDAIFVTTTTTATTVNPPSADGPTNPIQFIGSRGSSSSSLNPEGGRVSKPARKRSRASRRTPTTLLNTDTSNFRAMVQQFTGGPVGPFGTSAGRGLSSSSSLNIPGFSYGLLNNPRQQQIGNQIPNAAGVGDGGGGGGGGGGFHHLQQYQQQFHQSPSPFLFSLGNNNNSINDGPSNSNTASDHAHLLLQPGMVDEGNEGGAPPPPETTSGGNENRGSGFLY
ncbi:VQ motif-containing protein 22 [Linum grandiflorum]